MQERRTDFRGGYKGVLSHSFVPSPVDCDLLALEIMIRCCITIKRLDLLEIQIHQAFKKKNNRPDLQIPGGSFLSVRPVYTSTSFLRFAFSFSSSRSEVDFSVQGVSIVLFT